MFEGSLRNIYRFYDYTLFGNGSLKNPGLKDPLGNETFFLKEPFFKVP